MTVDLLSVERLLSDWAHVNRCRLISWGRPWDRAAPISASVSPAETPDVVLRVAAISLPLLMRQLDSELRVHRRRRVHLRLIRGGRA